MKPIIIPAILPQNKEELKLGLEKIKSFSRWVQIDIADGKFVKNQTIPLELIEEFFSNEFKNFSVELHLMVEDPFRKLFDLKNFKPNRVYIHFETIKKNDLNDLKNKMSRFEFEIGLAINPETEINDFFPIGDFFKSFLFLTVNPGFQGQEFLVSVLDKIKKFQNLFREKKISVDGGVNEGTIKFLKGLNLSSIIVGSFIFKDQNPKKAYFRLLKEIT